MGYTILVSQVPVSNMSLHIAFDFLRYFYYHGLTLIPAWISNYIQHKVWMKLLIQAGTSTVQRLKCGDGWVISSRTLLGMGLLGAKLIYISNRGHWMIILLKRRRCWVVIFAFAICTVSRHKIFWHSNISNIVRQWLVIAPYGVTWMKLLIHVRNQMFGPVRDRGHSVIACFDLVTETFQLTFSSKWFRNFPLLQRHSHAMRY